MGALGDWQISALCLLRLGPVQRLWMAWKLVCVNCQRTVLIMQSPFGTGKNSFGNLWIGTGGAANAARCGDATPYPAVFLGIAFSENSERQEPDAKEHGVLMRLRDRRNFLE